MCGLPGRRKRALTPPRRRAATQAGAGARPPLPRWAIGTESRVERALSCRDALDDTRRVPPLAHADALDAAATRLDELASDDRLERPVAAFHEHVGSDLADDPLGRVLVEQRDEIDAFER